jgi:hypothetical protein
MPGDPDGAVPPYAEEIRLALLSAFSKYEQLEILVADRLHENLPHIVSDRLDLTVVTFELLKWADKHGRTGELVCAANAARPGEPALRVLAAAFSCPEAPSPTAIRSVPPANWENVRDLWREVRDLHDDPGTVNNDDVARAINVVNETARLLVGRDALLELFRADYGGDYCTLCGKLSRNGYGLRPGMTSRDALVPAALELFRKLTC